jgi:hopanoid biosynthesis associated radical SAM protein HpnJ
MLPATRDSGLKTLFLQAPSFEGFDGGAGSRYQARREIKSFWYPTWLAQPAALVPNSRLLDAPADGLSVEQVLAISQDYELIIIHTSTPSFRTDARFAELVKREHPRAVIGMVGARVMVAPESSLRAAPSVDFVCHEEFDFTCQDVAAGVALSEVKGLTYRDADDDIRSTPPRSPLEDMDQLPFVAPVYKRDLTPANYFIGYLKHPYVSLYTGRGCRSKCTFCLWPQTVGGHRYRVRSAENVIAEVAWIKENMPQVREVMFDDDTFTDTSNLPRVEAIARGLGRLGMTWSCNAKANVPYPTLRTMKENGLRLLLVGYESGDDQILHNIKKGLRTDIARRFARDCHRLGITVHGTFILGLPGETTDTIRKTIEFAKEINPHTIQVSLAAPYPGTTLYAQARAQGWLRDEGDQPLVDEHGVQLAALSYPHLSSEAIFASVEVFYRQFYFRPSKIWEITREMLVSPEMMVRRLREGVEFFHFLRARAA